jgi:diaminohydroxyphosphoribosylaminopyrimidine deaminase/5-amino-6-(5-phosphoribosylamino)uracil reductase
MHELADTTDRKFMAKAIKLAARGLYSTQPNPRVGCVIVKSGEVVGQGWHEFPGEGHAEINALQQAGDMARGATAYVTLEPCSHQGRTGPCCVALVEAGISRAVIAMQDPNPKVSGNGIRHLTDNDIEVQVLLLEEAAVLNPGYIKRQLQGLPIVRCKLAMSLDGRTALSNGVSKWITGSAAREDVQRLRARSCAIVTGVDTVLTDNPSMTIRREQLNVPDVDLALRKQPLRVVLDSRLRIPLDAAILTPANETIVICVEGHQNTGKQEMLESMGVEVHCIAANNERSLDLLAVVKFLADRECNEVLVETGATLAGSMISARLVDELILYVNPGIIGNTGLPLLQLPEIARMDDSVSMRFGDVRMLGEDLKITAVFT